eukprot:242234-Prymnesium_polylepis.1
MLETIPPTHTRDGRRGLRLRLRLVYPSAIAHRHRGFEKSRRVSQSHAACVLPLAWSVRATRPHCHRARRPCAQRSARVYDRDSPLPSRFAARRPLRRSLQVRVVGCRIRCFGAPVPEHAR